MRFEKVSFEEFCDSLNVTKEFRELMRPSYDAIKLPQRSTDGSAGYDFVLPITVNAVEDVYYTVPTGIRFVVEDNDPDVFLMCVPRSGLGFKNGFRLINTAGIIDRDYWRSDNQGHIMCKFSVENGIFLEAGKAFMQGIIVPYLTVENDKPKEIKRNGGFGSTDR